jgi:hypothetical protein
MLFHRTLVEKHFRFIAKDTKKGGCGTRGYRKKNKEPFRKTEHHRHAAEPQDERDDQMGVASRAGLRDAS